MTALAIDDSFVGKMYFLSEVYISDNAYLSLTTKIYLP